MCVSSPDRTGPGPTSSLLRKRSTAPYPGEFPTPFACMIGGLPCDDAQMNSRNTREKFHSLSSNPAALDTPRTSYGSAERSITCCRCCQLEAILDNNKNTQPEQNNNKMQGTRRNGLEGEGLLTVSCFDVGAGTKVQPKVQHTPETSPIN